MSLPICTGSSCINKGYLNMLRRFIPLYCHSEVLMFLCGVIHHGTKCPDSIRVSSGTFKLKYRSINPPIH